MSVNTPIDADSVDNVLAALGDQLSVRGESYSIVVVGGSGLLALGVVTRTTRDVDVVALLDEGSIVPANELPDGLLAAARVVAADFGLPSDWLNNGPASLVDFGLPPGLLERATHRAYGHALDVLFVSREDQIHFKLYAVVDQGAGKHLSDLEALAPSESELLQAARWTRRHDPSEGYREVLLRVLDHFGVSADGANLI